MMFKLISWNMGVILKVIRYALQISNTEICKKKNHLLTITNSCVLFNHKKIMMNVINSS